MALRLRTSLVLGAVALTGLGVAVPALAAGTGRGDKISTALAPLVTDGTITQQQADKVADTLATLPLDGPGRGGPGGHLDLDSAAVAEVLGLSEDALRTQLETKSLATIAKERNVAVAKVIATIVDAEKARLAERVTAGEITQAQADARIATLTERVTERVSSLRPAGGPGGHGPGGHGGPGGPGLREASAAVAKVLGLTEAELRTQLREGKTLAAIAEAEGVDVQEVIDAIVTEAKAHLAEEVAEGDLTQEQADERLATLTDRVNEQVSTAGPLRGKGFGFGPRGERPGADDEAEVPTPTPTS